MIIRPNRAGGLSGCVWRNCCNPLFNGETLSLPYEEMRRICDLLNLKGQSRRSCRNHARALLKHIEDLKKVPFKHLNTLAETLTSWAEPIAAMWRFSRSNSITEGFHRKMKLIQRRAYGFRNFNNYRLRVIAQCG